MARYSNLYGRPAAISQSAGAGRHKQELSIFRKAIWIRWAWRILSVEALLTKYQYSNYWYLSKSIMTIRDIENHLERGDARIERFEKIEAVREKKKNRARIIRFVVGSAAIGCAL